MIRKGDNSSWIIWMLLLLSLTVGAYLYVTPSQNPVSLGVSLEFNYQGQINGSFTLTYEWTSKDVASKSPGIYDITWTQDVAQAEGSPSLSIDYFIKDHFATIVAEQGLWSIDSSGRWQINILQVAGSFVNLNYAIVGSNDTVNRLVIGTSINKSLDDFTGGLSAYGASNLGVKISAKVTIPGNMLMDLINRTAELIMGITKITKQFISLIVGTGSQILQLLGSS